MIRYLCIALVFVVGVPASVRAQEAVTITIRPQAPPVPALKYQLLPQIVDLKPGNAAINYYRSFSPETISSWRSDGVNRKVEAWRKMPLKDLPRHEIRSTASWVLKQFDLGARCDVCDWQMDAKTRAEGITLLLPDLQAYRSLLEILAARARVDIAEENFSQAAYTLQTGFAFTRHLCQYPTLISYLVAAADADLLLDQVETFIQAPGAPNLYWALTNLPAPMLELHKALLLEQVMDDYVFPSWRLLDKGPVSSQEAWPQCKQLITFLGEIDVAPKWTPQWRERLLIPLMMCKCYPTAKRYLIENGGKSEEVEAMAVLQVVILFSVEKYRERWDEIVKWLNMPYWQARIGMVRAERDASSAAQKLEDGLPGLGSVLPPMSKIIIRQASIDRRIACLRVIEVIRLYAESHGGKLPGRLSDITEVPVPIDPMTGKGFNYKIRDDEAVLSGPTEGIGSRTSSINYVLKLANNSK